MKPDPRLNTRHKVRKTAGQTRQRTLIVIPGENQSRLVPVEEAEQGFSRDQLKKLVRDVDARHVHTREFDGKGLTYIEGWYAMAQANAIFGYAGWDRETVHFERVIERTKSDANIICGYMARVRIRVRAGSAEIVREGTGWGSASASTATAANERALKSAETDATKRALSTFGSRFGLSLYDKDHVVADQRPTFTLFTPDGRPLAENLSPESYSTGLRQLIELCKDTHEVDKLSRYNRSPLSELRAQAPTLRNAQSVHFADLLLRLIQRRRERVSATGAERSGSNASATSPITIAPSESDGPTTPLDRSESLPARVSSNDRGPSASFRPGEASGRYTGQSPHRRTPYPFPSRSEISAPRRPDTSNDAKVTAEKVVEAENLTSESTVEDPAPQAAVTRPSVPGRAVSKDCASTVNGASPENVTAPILTGDLAGESIAATETTETHGRIEPAPPPSKISFGLKIDKSKLFLGLERRIRDKAHLRGVAELPCLVCNRQPSHAHHLRFAQRRGLSQKVSDEFVVPLCALHHGDLHRSSSEQEWWAKQKIDPVPISSDLWIRHRRP